MGLSGFRVTHRLCARLVLPNAGGPRRTEANGRPSEVDFW